MNSHVECKCCNPRAAAVALGRWVLGLLFLLAGIAKLTNVSGFVKSLVTQFEKTSLPAVLVSIFGHVLPFLETTLGVLLLLGLFRNVALFGAGILLIWLTFGQMLLGQQQVIFFNFVYVFLTAGLLFLAEHDRWVLFPRTYHDQAAPTPNH
jgi:thiosulfate dehydrogenase (quinone) large subunit